MKLHPPAGIEVIAEPSDMVPYLNGVRGEQGKSPFVVCPTSTEQVQQCVRHCQEQGIDYVAQSGNTGLVGASVPDDSGSVAVLSLRKVREVFELDVANRSVRVSAGMRLSELNARLEQHDLFFPIDLGSDPMIGGMVATNTGGSRFLRYGDVRRNVLGLTVVLNTPEADILTLGSPLRKNNIGPDWKQNYIGTFGWYGVITEVTLNLEPTVKEQATALIVPKNDAAMLAILQHLETRVGSLLSAFEFMSEPAIRHTFHHVSSLSNPFVQGVIPKTALLVELSRTTRGASWDAPLDDVLQAVLMEIWEQADSPIEDAMFGRPEEIWALRHGLSEGVKSAGPLIAFDLAFTRDQVAHFRQSMQKLLPQVFPNIEICDFGHLGDGGLHFNLIKTDGPCQPGFEQDLRDWVVQRAVEDFGGSYSAEHGIGPKNLRYFARYASLSADQLYRQSEVLRFTPGTEVTL